MSETLNEILVVNGSPNGCDSAGFQLAANMLDRLCQIRPQLHVTFRDLLADPLEPIGAAYSAAIRARCANEAPAFAQSERLITELERCDVLLIITPIHNFTLPAALKLWVDQVVRVWRSFSYGPTGKEGLLADRPTYLLISSGGIHCGAEANQPEFITPYLRCVLNTIGLHDLHFIYLQGLASGPGAATAALINARQQLRGLALFSELNTGAVE